MHQEQTTLANGTSFLCLNEPRYGFYVSGCGPSVYLGPPTMLSGKRAQTTKKKSLSANRVATGSTDGSADAGANSLCGHLQRLVQSDPFTSVSLLQIPFALQAASNAC